MASMCDNCQADHARRIEQFISSAERRCYQCGRSMREVEGDEAGNITMFVHFKDGVYQLLCPQCSVSYTAKRKDLYGDTPWFYQHTGGL